VSFLSAGRGKRGGYAGRGAMEVTVDSTSRGAGEVVAGELRFFALRFFFHSGRDSWTRNPSPEPTPTPDRSSHAGPLSASSSLLALFPVILSFWVVRLRSPATGPLFGRLLQARVRTSSSKNGLTREDMCRGHDEEADA
jgi:hypothetical protein